MGLSRALLALALSFSTLASAKLQSSRILKRFGEQQRFVTTALTSARSGHHHSQNEKCGETPGVFDKYEFSPCYTCFHHVMNVKGINVNGQGEEVEKRDLGTVANYWLHNGLPATHFYDTHGDLVALLWSATLSTPKHTKEFVILADCHDTS